MLHSRLEAAWNAVNQVLNGARASDVESDTVDFKEEAGTVGVQGVRQAISDHFEPAARALALEAACLANTQDGGVLVVGVNDTGAGPAACTGAYLDTVWLRERIHALTQPHLSVDVIQEHEVAGKRLYFIDVAPSLQEVLYEGKLRTRVGRTCQELQGDQARRFLEMRHRYDWSAEASTFRLSQADPAALETTSRYYREARDQVPAGTRALVSQLGLLADPADAEDPRLNQAGAVLLCPVDPTAVQVDLQVKRTESVASRERLEAPAPLLEAFEHAWRRIEAHFPATPELIGPLRHAVRAIPERAAREALVNALMHREYRQVHNRVVVTVLGEPAHTFKIVSPGGFPPGVTADRLITTPSRPRNRVLADAFHVLRLAEREGIGVDQMYIAMLRDGHPAPEIAEVGGDVVCLLRGGAPDLRVRAFFVGVASSQPELGDDVRFYVAVTDLLKAPELRPEALAEHAQCTHAEALATLEAAQRAGVVERLLDRSRTFRLTARARQQLQSRLAYQPRSAWEDHWLRVQAYLDAYQQIGRGEAAEVLGVGEGRAAQILGELVRRGLLAPVGNARGRGVRYHLPAAGQG